MTTTTTENRTFSRRTFVKGAGVMVVAIGAPRLFNPKAAAAAVNPNLPSLEFSCTSIRSGSARRRSTRTRSTRGSRSTPTARS